MKIYGVTGWKNAGKTGLMERLLAEITSRGLSVSTIKHAHHSFDVDHPGKDSHRHRVAGAHERRSVDGEPTHPHATVHRDLQPNPNPNPKP